MNKKALSERDICTKCITPSLTLAGWDINTQVMEEFQLTKGRVIVRGQLHTRAKHKRADYVLFYKPNIPIAVIEAKDNNHSIGAGMQQALGYAELLQVPFAFSSNGDGFLFHNSIVKKGHIETELSMDNFPSPEHLWKLWCEKFPVALPAFNEQKRIAAMIDNLIFQSDKMINQMSLGISILRMYLKKLYVV